MRKTGVLRAHRESIRNFRTEVARGSAISARWRTESFRPNAFPGADLIIRECDRVTGQSSSGHEPTFVHQAKGLDVEGLRCDPGIGHLQLVGAQRLRRRGVGGTVPETGEILDGADVVLSTQIFPFYIPCFSFCQAASGLSRKMGRNAPIGRVKRLDTR